MDKKFYYKYMFLIAAIYNWIAGISIILLTIFLLPVAISIFEMEPPPSLVFAHSFMILVIVFGIGFYMISVNLEKNYIIVILGIIEKFLVVVVWAIYIGIGEVGLGALPIIIGDFIFGCLFLEFLINHKKL